MDCCGATPFPAAAALLLLPAPRAAPPTNTTPSTPASMNATLSSGAALVSAGAWGQGWRGRKAGCRDGLWQPMLRRRRPADAYCLSCWLTPLHTVLPHPPCTSCTAQEQGEDAVGARRHRREFLHQLRREAACGGGWLGYGWAWLGRWAPKHKAALGCGRLGYGWVVVGRGHEWVGGGGSPATL